VSGTIREQDEIGAIFRAESARLRRRIFAMSAVPLAVGVAVFVAVHLGVRNARGQLDELNLKIEELESKRAELEGQIATRRDLLQSYVAKLSADDQAEFRLVEEGLERFDRGDTEKAVAAFDRAISLNANNEISYRLRGAAYLAAGEASQAIESLRKSIELNPKDGEAYYALSLALWEAGSKDEAARAAQTAFALDRNVEARRESGGDDAERIHIEEGLAAAKIGNFREAIAAYDRALERNPRNYRVEAWRGYALYRNGDFRNAVESLERAITLNPKHAEARYNLALALWKSGMTKEAVQALRRTYEVDSGYRRLAEQDPQSRGVRQQLMADAAGDTP
jgi:tetratricopeptide (TPR) repeat protein